MNKDDYKKLKDKLCSHDRRYDEEELIEKLMLENLQLQKGGAQNELCKWQRTSCHSSKGIR